jgi:pyridoxamine 5'-phosphate oxidase
MELAGLRRDYVAGTLEIENLKKNPFDQFAIWFRDAADSGLVHEVNAMTLSTFSPEEGVSSRTVLLKGLDPDGFRFFTNYRSCKGRQMAVEPRVALLFYWGAMERQIHICGRAERMPENESRDYFQQRPRGSQLGAWASEQSAVLPDRTSLEQRYAALEKQWEGKEIPLPPHWGGFVVRPTRFEFWQGRSNRLHDRYRYRKGEGSWLLDRLSP